MQGTLRTVRTLAVGFALLGSLSGCEAQDCDNEETGAEGVCLKSLKRFEAPAESDSLPYTAGGDVLIDSPNGDIFVTASGSSDVVATFQPFVLRAFDTPPEEAQEDIDQLERVLEADGEDVLIDVSRPDGVPPTLGADIVAELPDDFSGRLIITQANGQTEVEFVGAAMGVSVTSNNGSCVVTTGAASEVSVSCDNGGIEGTIEAEIAQTGSGFFSGNGDIVLSVPADGVFSVQASTDFGSVIAENMPESCELNGTVDSAKTLSCNGATTEDPIYDAYTENGDVVFTF
jgi:hypothetical protein